ncbi:MAG: aminotransferase class III-fold pyridoxal phosphate-dependent enzyme [bacterium]
MVIEKHIRPKFSAKQAEAFAEQLYGLKGAARQLPSERDQNFYLQSESDAEFVLKIAGATEKLEVLDFQNQAMRHLATSEPAIRCPKVCPTQSGKLIATVQGEQDAVHLVRLLTYLPGVPLARVNPHAQELLQELGCFLGRMDLALANFSHPAVHRAFYWDLKNAPAIINRYKGRIQPARQRALVDHFLDQFNRYVWPQLPSLRTSVIHNDGNDYNIIVNGSGSWKPKSLGIIDFGDMVHTCTVFELAVALVYVMLGKPDPLAAAAPVVQGYHSVNPLDEQELEVLFTLICARACMSVTIAAQQKQNEPGNEYLKITEAAAWSLLHRLKDVHPRLAHYTFRHACDLPPCPQSKTVVNWLKNNQHKLAGVVPVELKADPLVVFDLSVGSNEWGTWVDPSDTETFSKLIFAKVQAAGAMVGIGRYDEARLLYRGPQFKSAGNETQERRTIHLGLDLFMEAGTPVCAPLAGKIHSLQNNAAPQDYGPTVIVEHQIPDSRLQFFTLYGHLSADSLEGWQPGMPVKKGGAIGRIGEASENGGWPPHLHFQLIIDLLGNEGDFPGVALPGEREIWLSLCPDPNLLLGIPAQAFPQPEMEKAKILQARKQSIGPSLSLSYQRPLQIVRGFLQYLYDETGRAYLDAVNNVAHVGHCHPRVVEALQRQVAVLNTNTRYLHEKLVRYARRLCAMLPEPLNVCFLVCSGSEANELALRLARTHTQARDVIVVDGAYHGNTQALIEISPYKFDGPGGSGAPPYVHKVAMPDGYRGKFKSSDAVAGGNYANEVREKIEQIQKAGKNVAAFICESLLGCGGQIVLPANYLKNAFAHVRTAGGVCIADEVQVGFGRVGSHFWGFETQGVVPDIVTLGKPIGNGHPLAAVVTTAEIAASFATGMEYFNTFGGNPVSCAVGMAVLDVIAEKRLQENALTVGNYLKSRLAQLQANFPLVGDVRGLGLFLGIELVLNRDTLEPAPEQATYIVERMKDHGILISTDGPLHNVLKIKPPLVFNQSNADFFVQTLAKILEEDFVRLG